MKSSAVRMRGSSGAALAGSAGYDARAGVVRPAPRHVFDTYVRTYVRVLVIRKRTRANGMHGCAPPIYIKVPNLKEVTRHLGRL